MTSISAQAFWTSFQRQFDACPPPGYGPQWTDGMYGVLHAVQEEFGLWCACTKKHGMGKGRKGEYLKIDFMWFEAKSGDWDPPLVAIEHENAWNFRETMVDFWRVCQVAAPLRVCFGYTSKKSDVLPLAEKLVSHRQGAGWRQLPGGEDLLVLGYDGVTGAEFAAWRFAGKRVSRLAATKATRPR